jgi:hypothetical protein
MDGPYQAPFFRLVRANFLRDWGERDEKGHMLYRDLLEEFFSIKKRKTWEYTFRKKPGSDLRVKDSSRIARTSSVARGNHFLFTIGAKRVAEPCELNEALVRIITGRGLTLETEETTAGNRDATYVGFDLASKACSRDTMRRVLEEAKLAVAKCSRKTGRPL